MHTAKEDNSKVSKHFLYNVKHRTQVYACGKLKYIVGLDEKCGQYCQFNQAMPGNFLGVSGYRISQE